jgi:hypothetical protein
MKKNMGTADRIIRLILAAVFAILYFTGTVTGTFGIVLIGFCSRFCANQCGFFLPAVSIGRPKHLSGKKITLYQPQVLAKPSQK